MRVLFRLRPHGLLFLYPQLSSDNAHTIACLCMFVTLVIMEKSYAAFILHRKISLEAVSYKNRSDCDSCCAAESAYYDRKHGRHDDAWLARRKNCWRSRTMRAAFELNVQLLLGLCWRRHAFYVAVLGRKGRRWHTRRLRHNDDTYD